jgi:hypothetical protein
VNSAGVNRLDPDVLHGEGGNPGDRTTRVAHAAGLHVADDHAAHAPHAGRLEARGRPGAIPFFEGSRFDLQVVPGVYWTQPLGDAKGHVP